MWRPRRGTSATSPPTAWASSPTATSSPNIWSSPTREDTVEQLKSAFKGADGLWLATDFDREGEAIAWHVAESIGADPATANRVTFTEITKDAVQRAFASRAASTSTW